MLVFGCKNTHFPKYSKYLVKGIFKIVRYHSIIGQLKDKFFTFYVQFFHSYVNLQKHIAKKNITILIFATKTEICAFVY